MKIDKKILNLQLNVQFLSLDIIVTDYQYSYVPCIHVRAPVGFMWNVVIDIDYNIIGLRFDIHRKNLFARVIVI